MRDYILQAVRQGMSEFGVSDHGPAYFLPGDHALPATQMALSELPAYVAEARDLQREFAEQISVRVGVEADFIEGATERLAQILDGQPFDYVLGSVHYAAGSSIFRRARWLTDDPTTVYTEYYRLLRIAATCGLFDILSHLTAVEAYGPPLPPGLAERLYPPVADAIAEGGCAVEINTSGYRKIGGDEPFPNRHLLRLLLDRGVPLTFGSDCHMPSEVGYGAARVASLLAEFGKDAAQARPFATRRGSTIRVFV